MSDPAPVTPGVTPDQWDVLAAAASILIGVAAPEVAAFALPLLNFVKNEGRILAAKGDITPEQLAKIDADAAVADADFDIAVTEATRTDAGGETGTDPKTA